MDPVEARLRMNSELAELHYQWSTKHSSSVVPPVSSIRDSDLLVHPLDLYASDEQEEEFQKAAQAILDKYRPHMRRSGDNRSSSAGTEAEAAQSPSSE